MLNRKIIGLNNDLKGVFKNIKIAADYLLPTLITGETGTGKEVIAESIHQMSPRKNKCFIKINCSAIPENLLESELFGYKKGAFTGAVTDKPGLIELADSGSLFLDEIGDMTYNLQGKLLRVLQEKEIISVGGNHIKKVDFHLISATNQNLEDLIKKNLFRNDLYFRINVFPIHLPPLRERSTDLGNLIRHLVQKKSQEYNLEEPKLTDRSLKNLLGYSWPGNIRELENVITRLLVTGIENSEIDIKSGDLTNTAQKDHTSLKKAIDVISSNIIQKQLTLKDLESKILTNILRKYNNNIPIAAQNTDISKNQFYRKIDKATL